MEDTDQLEREWSKTGKTCDHPKVEKEYYLDTTTGDYRCAQCGAGVGKTLFEKRREEKNARFK